MHPRYGITLALGLSSPVAANTAVDCDVLHRVLEDLSGYSISAPPATAEDIWCVLGQARLTAAGRPDLTLDRLRVMGRGELAEGPPIFVSVELTGLRLSSKAAERQVPEWLQSAMRLQSADIAFLLYTAQAEDLLNIRAVSVKLSGGMVLELDVQIRSAGMSATSILTGELTELLLRLRNDGRTLRPAMEAAGAALDGGALGARAIDSARAALNRIADALPEDNLFAASREEIMSAIRGLPQERGEFVLRLSSTGGIGAADIGLLALAEDPVSPEALARFLRGTVLNATWQPGLAP